MMGPADVIATHGSSPSRWADRARKTNVRVTIEGDRTRRDIRMAHCGKCTTALGREHASCRRIGSCILHGGEDVSDAWSILAFQFSHHLRRRVSNVATRHQGSAGGASGFGRPARRRLIPPSRVSPQPPWHLPQRQRRPHASKPRASKFGNLNANDHRGPCRKHSRQPATL